MHIDQIEYFFELLNDVNVFFLINAMKFDYELIDIIQNLIRSCPKCVPFSSLDIHFYNQFLFVVFILNYLIF